MQNEIWIFFDKDGTLIELDSIWIPWAKRIYAYLKQEGNFDWELSETAFLQQIGVQLESMTIDLRSPLAIGSIQETEIIVAFILYRHGLGWDRAMLLAKWAVTYANEGPYLETVTEMPGVIDFIQALYNNGFKMGVLTADTTKRAEESIDKIGIKPFFEFIYGSDLVAYSKPFPDLAFLARDRFKIDLSKAVMIGDSNADMLLAKNAGLSKAIGLVPSANLKEHILLDADIVVTSYSQLTIQDLIRNEG